jgi:hypothetical protein
MTSPAEGKRMLPRLVVGAIVVAALVLVSLRFGVDRTVQGVSPDGRWRAIATRNPDEPGARYRVGLGPAAGEVEPRRSYLVWRSESHEPTKLEWRGSDTLLVIARKRGTGADSVWIDSSHVEGIVVRSDLR